MAWKFDYYQILDRHTDIVLKGLKPVEAAEGDGERAASSLLSPSSCHLCSGVGRPLEPDGVTGYIHCHCPAEAVQDCSMRPIPSRLH